MANKKLSDEQLLETIQDFKACTEKEIEEVTGYFDLSKRLKKLIINNKLNYKVIPHTRTNTHYKFFEGYQGTRVYFLTEEEFGEWVISLLPNKLTPIYRRVITRIVNDLKIKVTLPETTVKKQLWLFNRELVNILEKKAKKNKSNISAEAEALMLLGLQYEKDGK